MSVAVIQFPGSNCDRDLIHVLKSVMKLPTAIVWHQDSALPKGTTAVVIPGGFSYGDYLRCGAIASTKAIMNSVKELAQAGNPVLGICNGFQILCEAGMLPGTLRPNRDGKFVCRLVGLTANVSGSIWSGALKSQQQIDLPIAHREGNYFADDVTLRTLSDEGRIAFEYVEKNSSGNGLWNGSRLGIAGILGGPKKNILGLMPHPERRTEERLGGTDGTLLFEALKYV